MSPKSMQSSGNRMNPILKCNNSSDVETLNGLIMRKVCSLKSVPNVYTENQTNTTRATLEVANDNYAEVFDSLVHPPSPPPPLPSRSEHPRAPARPPYPSTRVAKKTA